MRYTSLKNSFAASQGIRSGFRAMTLLAFALYLCMASAFAALWLQNSRSIIEGHAFMMTSQAHASAYGNAATLMSENSKRRILRAVSYNPANIEKLDGQGIYTLFDAPDMVRADLPTVTWQYRSESCVLDVYFRSDLRDAIAAPVVHFETRSRQAGDDIEKTQCLREMLPQSYGPRMVSVSAFYKSYIQ